MITWLNNISKLTQTNNFHLRNNYPHLEFQSNLLTLPLFDHCDPSKEQQTKDLWRILVSHQISPETLTAIKACYVSSKACAVAFWEIIGLWCLLSPFGIWYLNKSQSHCVQGTSHLATIEKLHLKPDWKLKVMWIFERFPNSLFYKCWLLWYKVLLKGFHHPMFWSAFIKLLKHFKVERSWHSDYCSAI